MLYFLHFMYQSNTAGGNRLLGYYKELEKMHIETTVVYLYPNETYDKIQDEFHYIHFDYFWHKLMPYRGAFRKLTLKSHISRFVKKLKPGDVVYTYFVSKLTSLCLGIKGVKVFAEVTESPEVINGFPHPLLALTSDEYKDTLMKMDGLIVISQLLKNYYIQLGIDESKILVVNMTVDLSRFASVKKQYHRDKIIAYCGTVSNYKDGVDVLIKAFNIVTKQVPNLKLYIIGKIPDKIEGNSNYELIQKFGIKDKVIFTGQVKAAEMPQLLKNADILALARPDNIQSRYGFPTKLGEYLVSENPVVVTSVGDIPLFLKDGVSAYLSEPSNIEAFAEKLLWAINNYEEARNIGEKGAAVAKKCFNSVIETKKLADFILNN